MFTKLNDLLKVNTANCRPYFKSYGWILVSVYLAFWILNKFILNPDAYENPFLRISIIIIGITLIFHNKISIKFIKYFHYYWYFILFYTLPFFFTLMWLNNAKDPSWGTPGLVFSLVALSLFVDRWSYIGLIFLGIIFGSISYIFTSDNPTVPENILGMIIAYFVILIYFIFFGKKQENLYKEKIIAFKAMGGTIAHEMRAPLAKITLIGQSLEKLIPILKKSYQIAKSNKLIDEEISSKNDKFLDHAAKNLELISKNAQKTINILLNNLKIDRIEGVKKIVSARQCIEYTLQNYPFSQHQLNLIHWENPTEDFEFLGDQNLFFHIFVNLIKNSIDAINDNSDPSIKIWIELSIESNKIHIQDNGKGIAKEHLPFIFDRFFTKKQQGTGLGLSFAKEAMESFGGEIECTSTQGMFTRFSLIFPEI